MIITKTLESTTILIILTKHTNQIQDTTVDPTQYRHRDTLLTTTSIMFHHMDTDMEIMYFNLIQSYNSKFLMLNTRFQNTNLNILSLSKILLVFVILFISSCSSKDPYLYDRTGFDYGTRPVVAANPNAPVRVAPDYYYRQPAYPQYQQPAYQQPYNQYPQQGYGGSRNYSNPYAFPAQPAYPNYDADQYYVPPTYYNNDSYQSNISNQSTTY